MSTGEETISLKMKLSQFHLHNMYLGKIGRHTRDFVIDVKPCKDYAFRVRKGFLT